MKIKHLILSLSIAMFLNACSHKPKDAGEQNNTVTTEIVYDSSAITEQEPLNRNSDNQEPYDWTSDGFKEDHYDEWVVVKHSIDLQQTETDQLDFNKIDVLVREYISKKGISLPKDTYTQIQKIEDICKSKFDISGYDESNFGMHIADGTARLFDEYVNWLLEKAAKKACKEIDFDKEKEMLKSVMDAFYMCCDSIAMDFGGSGGWMGTAELHRMELNFWKSMYRIVLTKSTHSKLPILITPQQFSDECAIRLTNYKQDYEDEASPQQVKRMLNDFDNAIRDWLEYRSIAENKISKTSVQGEYSYITRSFARELFVHLKNNFGDIGIMSESMYDHCYLHLDCTDEELINYSFEEAYQRYINN